MIRRTIYHVLILILIVAIIMTWVTPFKWTTTTIMKILSTIFFAKSFKDGETFSMMHLNIRSIQSNLSKLDQFMANLNTNFDIIGISETWLSDLNQNIYQLDGYNHESLVRPDRTHGGVSMFISSLIPYRVLNEICIVVKDIECLFIEIVLNRLKIYIGIIYRTPDCDVRFFCDHLMNILEKIKLRSQPCYLMGDYNIDLLTHATHNPTSEFLDMMFSNIFIPLVNKPTRITSNSATIIDNIYTQMNIKMRIKTWQEFTDISDHYPIFHIMQCQKKTQAETYQLIRLINQICKNISIIFKIMIGQLLINIDYAKLLFHISRKH